jgi:hypothetical protein
MTAAGYSLWLLPEPAVLAELTALVATLAPRFGQPAFMPHVTVQGDLAAAFADDLAVLCAHAEAMAAETAALTWRVEAVESTTHFFRCLYLRFADTPAFGALQARAQAATGTATGLSPYPHLSLAYGEALPDPAEMAALKATLATRWTGRVLRLDRLALCRSSKDLPIADWRCVLTLPLAPPGTGA